MGDLLLLGEDNGWLELVDIETFSISQTHKFTEGGLYINDIIAIDDIHYLLAARGGLLKTTNDQLIKNYYKGKEVKFLCHITGSLYLVGFYGKVIVWNEQKE